MKKIAALALFEGLDAEAVAAVERRVVVQTHPPQKTILQSNELSTDLFFVLEGRVQAKIFSSDGHQVTFTELGEGTIFGEFSAIDGKERSADVVALTAVTAALMRASDFHALMLRHPQIGVNLARHLVAKVRALSERFSEFGLLPVPLRIRRALLRLAEQGVADGNDIVIDPAPSHYELATYIATHREAVSRELMALAARGVIQQGRRRIVIHDIHKLIGLCRP